MSLKTKIKNDLWRINYVIPFSHRHQFDEKGKANTIKHVLKTFRTIKPIKGSGTRSVGSDTKKLLSEVQIEIDENSHFVYFLDTTKTIAVPGNVLSNFPLDYNKVIHNTFNSLCEAADGNDDYGQEAQLVAEGIRELTERIINAISESSYNPDQKKRLQSYFAHILDTPAAHFDEALQRVLFFNQIMWQTRHRLNGLGRLDLILGDIYENDIKDGTISEEEAHSFVYDFLAQLNKYKDYKSDALEGDIGQIIILGGLDSEGNYFCNELTKIFLQEQAHLKKPDPKTFLRVSKKMPRELIEIAVKCLSSSTGSPLLSNDDVVITALESFGMPAKDACNYCTSACWEPFIVGKSLDQNNIGVFDYFLALEDAMEEEAHSYQEFVEHYIKKNEERFKVFLSGLNELIWAKDPLVSMFTDGCTEERKDISTGSSIYKDYGITTVALSNVIDSFENIKRLIYEEKRYTLSELNEIRKTNYSNHEELLTELIQSEKAYGHDDPETIDLVNRITRSLLAIAKDYRNPLGGTVKFGLSSSSYNILSKGTNADVSGRKAGMAYNTHISCIDAPYTEVINFASQLEYDQQRFNGNVVDFFVSPSLIESNTDKFVRFLEGAIDAGFFQMQMNVLDSKMLIDAKAHPEKYEGLIVRVWGFSAYFNELPESYKNLLIERAIAAEKVV